MQMEHHLAPFSPEGPLPDHVFGLPTPDSLSCKEPQEDSENLNWLAIWNDISELNLYNTQNDDSYELGVFGIQPLDTTGGIIEEWARQELVLQPPCDSGADNSSLDVTYDGSIVCLGKIHQTRIRLIGDMKTLINNLNSPQETSDSRYYQFGIQVDSSGLYLCLSNDNRFAMLNKQMNDVLGSNGMMLSGVRLQVLTLAGKFRKAIYTAKKSSEAHAVVDINIYAASTCAEEVGSYLSANKVWLQKPDWCDAGLEYRNPQLFYVDRSHGQLPPEVISSTSGAGSSTNDANFDAILSDMFSSLERTAHLGRTAGDIRFVSTLMPHQEQALDFMIERENGPIRDVFSLWTSSGQADSQEYQHKFCGIEEFELPVETGGGILADAMGIGKTFSTLALIVHTLEDALAWCKSHESHEGDDIPEFKTLSRATLVVVPSPQLLNNWRRELQDRVGMELAILVYHGHSRPRELPEIVQHDIVFTTYQTIVADHNRGSRVLDEIGWFRIVLDEAHFIRRSTSKFFRYVSELDAKFRWCLTGTPIQNHLDDIGSLLAFIRIYPFNRIGAFRKYISIPFYEGGSGRTIYQAHLRMLIDAVCLRRTEAILNLRGLDQIIRSVTLSKAERNLYNQAKDDIKIAFQEEEETMTRLKRFSMFQAQLYLRLVCNHGTYQQPFSHGSVSRLDMRDDALCAVGTNGDAVCALCKQVIRVIDSDIMKRPKNRSCRHIICLDCGDSSSNACPLCNDSPPSSSVRLTPPLDFTAVSHSGNFEPRGYSSKMSALVRDLSSCGPASKSIVFSCWTTTLDLIEHTLKRAMIKYQRIDGDIPTKTRENILQNFETDTTLPVLIMTMGVGALGLNVITANQILLVEPQWNPSVEAQAIGRALRIGQTQKVKVIRYVVEDSVEKDMRKIQSRKIDIARMAQEQTMSMS